MPDDKPISRIVVPVDGSPFAESAITPAAALARRVGVPLTLFGLTYDEQGRDRLLEKLEEVTSPLPDELLIDVVVNAVGAVVHVEGHVPASILEEASTDGALVCIASHGRSGLGAALLGSVTEQVLRQSPRPVLVVGPQCKRRLNLDGGLIVACLDGSELAERAVPAAATWAAGLGLPLWLVQVVDPSTDPASDLVPSGDFRETAYLNGISQQYSSAEFDVLHSRHAARELADLPDRWDVATLVLATHGRSGWSRLALGSVAMNVVHHATCPVLVVRPHNKEDQP